jgi:pyridoxal phosphate enzyme (YggS family)
MAAAGLSVVRERIAAAAATAGRDDLIRLVVVVKYASDDQVAAVIADGASDLGESRAQALAGRAERFRGVSWHFVGRLQRNKAAAVRSSAELLHSMDRPSLARTWADPAAPPVLIQVNLADEPQKGGVGAAEAPALVETCRELGVEVRGLMTVPPRPDRPEDSSPWFAKLRRLRDAIAADHPEVKELSMGMSDDFEAAIAEGATILRVGRAIFDPFEEKG